MAIARQAPRDKQRRFAYGKVLGRFNIAITLVIAVVAPAIVWSTTTVTGSQAQVGGIGLRILDVPNAERNDSRSRLYFIDHLAPRAVIHRRIEISNTTCATAHVALYAAAATIEHGTFVGSAAHTQNDLSAGVTIRPPAIDVSADGRATATVTIAIPIGTAPGEKYAAVWAEVRDARANSDGISHVNRVGIRLYISVGPGGAPASNFVISTLAAERSRDGQPIVVASVRNSGGRALDLHGTLQLTAGPAGLSAGPFPANVGVTLAVGDTGPITIPLDRRVPAGPWDARLTMHSGLLTRTADATIMFPASGTSPPVAATSPSKGQSRNHVAIAGLALFAVGAAAVALNLRRRGGRSSGRSEAPAG